MTPDAKDLCVFAVKRGDMKNRLDINYNSPDLVGKTTVFDSDVLCAASNHMTRITVKEGVNPYYVVEHMSVEMLRR